MNSFFFIVFEDTIWDNLTKRWEDKRIDERIKWDEIIFLGIGNETDDKRMDNKFSRAFEGKMSFSLCEPKEENEIIEDERWGVIL